ncbi:MAG: hypothetical protein H0W09_08230 [Solirubrobacterales bacterium]|nr:hypothetical protein [Solirubrobacterales bacterium]
MSGLAQRPAGLCAARRGALAIFADRHNEGTWAERKDAWNELYPSWRYSEASAAATPDSALDGQGEHSPCPRVDDALDRGAIVLEGVVHGPHVAPDAIVADVVLVDSDVVYSIYIGLLQLSREVPERLVDEDALTAELLQLLGED